MLDNLVTEFGKIQPKTKVKPKETAILDGATDKEKENDNTVAIFQERQIVSEALALLAEWFETAEDDLDPNEGLGERLYSLTIAIADTDKNGEISDDEAEVINIGMNAMADYLIEKGVSEENAIALFENFDNDVAKNVHDFVVGKIPESDEALFEELDKIVFSEAENEPVLDGIKCDDLTLDATYRKVFAIRHGKKMRIRKRVSGVVRLSPKQKVAIRKAQRRANTGAAKMKRLRSFKLRRRLGI